jgi:hypothetical protein
MANLRRILFFPALAPHRIGFYGVHNRALREALWQFGAAVQHLGR